MTFSPLSSPSCARGYSYSTPFGVVDLRHLVPRAAHEAIHVQPHSGLRPIRRFNAVGRGIQIGGTAGANISSHLKNFKFQNGDIDLDFSPNLKVGLNGGLIVQLPINKSLRLHAEPSVARIGARYDDRFTLRGFEFQSDSKVDLLYVQLPLLIQLSTVPPERTVFGRQRAETTYHVTGGLRWLPA